jgi:hypothetical protein
LSDIWAPVAAAIGASALTALATWGLDVRREARRARAERSDERQRAYVTLLDATYVLILALDALRMAAELRSGLVEASTSCCTSAALLNLLT